MELYKYFNTIRIGGITNWIVRNCLFRVPTSQAGGFMYEYQYRIPGAGTRRADIIDDLVPSPMNDIRSTGTLLQSDGRPSGRSKKSSADFTWNEKYGMIQITKILHKTLVHTKEVIKPLTMGHIWNAARLYLDLSPFSNHWTKQLWTPDSTDQLGGGRSICPEM